MKNTRQEVHVCWSVCLCSSSCL